jgi:organic hydroperoxide reductase OsmC/OhrA
VAGIHLRVQAQVAGLDEDRFVAMAMQAKDTCLVSRLLKTAVSLEAALSA